MAVDMKEHVHLVSIEVCRIFCLAAVLAAFVPVHPARAEQPPPPPEQKLPQLPPFDYREDAGGCCDHSAGAWCSSLAVRDCSLGLNPSVSAGLRALDACLSPD